MPKLTHFLGRRAKQYVLIVQLHFLEEYSVRHTV